MTTILKQFPAMLRKMWSGAEVQQWLDENVAPLLAAQPSQAVRDVMAERQRQISVKGWTHEHDDEHVNDEIAAMAALYILPDGARDWDATSTGYGETLADAILPLGWNMPNFDGRRRDDLVKGAAMALAEIERMDREAEAAQPKWKPCTRCTTPNYCTHNLRGCDRAESSEAGIEPLCSTDAGKVAQKGGAA